MITQNNCVSAPPHNSNPRSEKTASPYCEGDTTHEVVKPALAKGLRKA